MKTMKKLVAALLVLTMVLALTGSAFAACSTPYAKFIKNGYAYSAPHSYKKVSGPEVIVHKGSVAKVLLKKGDYVYLQLTLAYPDCHYGNDYVVDPVTGTKLYFWGYWFKSSDLGNTKKTNILVTFSNGGVGKSKALLWPIPDAGQTQITDSCKKHVKATAKVWMHKTPSLSSSYGKALHKDDVVKYRRVYGIDSRNIIFWGIRYEGKNLYVSSAYSKVVK